MQSNIMVNVFIESVGANPPPAKGAIKFTYVLDSAGSDKWVHVYDNGDIYAGNANDKKTSLTFVLKPHNLEWSGQKYSATFKPTQSQPDGAAEMIYISTDTTKSPSARWPSDDNRFKEFTIPSTTARDALRVVFDRDPGAEEVFQYSVAVNVSNSQNQFVATVRDDPQIKDRGVPTAPNYYELLAAIMGILAGALITYLIMKRRIQRFSQPN